MRKKVILISVIAAFLLCGCVSQKDYDDLQAEADSLKTQNEELTEQVVELSGQVAELSGQVAELTGQISDLTNQLEAARIELEQYKSASEIGKNIAETTGEYYEKGKEAGRKAIDELKDKDWGKVKEEAEKKARQAAETVKEILGQEQ